MNNDSTREFRDEAPDAAYSSKEFEQAETEYADEYTLNDIGLVLRLQAFAESA